MGSRSEGRSVHLRVRSRDLGLWFWRGGWIETLFLASDQGVSGSLEIKSKEGGKLF